MELYDYKIRIKSEATSLVANEDETERVLFPFWGRGGGGWGTGLF